VGTALLYLVWDGGYVVQLVGLAFLFSRPKGPPIWDRRHQLVGEEMTALWHYQEIVYHIRWYIKIREGFLTTRDKGFILSQFTPSGPQHSWTETGSRPAVQRVRTQNNIIS